MKNIILFVVFILSLVFVQFAKGQSVDDVISDYIAARGGKDKLKAIKSLYLEGTRQMMGNEVQVKVTKVEGKLSRIDFDFGSGSGYSIVTPDKGWTYFPMRSDKPDEIPQARLKSMQDQLDIAGPLVDYSSKGDKVTLQGKETVLGKEAFKILLTNSAGKESTYYIDTKTHLLIQSKQMSEGGGKGVTEIVTDFSDYKDVDGVMFPQTINVEGSGMGSGSMTFDTIKTNIPIDDKLYKPSN